MSDRASARVFALSLLALRAQRSFTGSRYTLYVVEVECGNRLRWEVYHRCVAWVYNRAASRADGANPFLLHAAPYSIERNSPRSACTSRRSVPYTLLRAVQRVCMGRKRAQRQKWPSNSKQGC